MKVGTVKLILMMSFLSGLMVMIGIIGNSLLNKFLNFRDYGTAWAAFFVSAFFIEEMTKYMFLRNFRLWSALGVILIGATIESLLYAFYAEIAGLYWGVSLAMIWGVWFWYTMLIRFIYNGHLIFFVWAAATTKMFNRYVPFLRRTGRTINLTGWLIGGSIHYLWNITLTYPSMADAFAPLAIILAIGTIVSLWGLGEFERFKTA